MQFFMMLQRLILLLGFGGMLVRLTAIVGFASRKKLGLAATGIYATSHGRNFNVLSLSLSLSLKASHNIIDKVIFGNLNSTANTHSKQL